MKLRAALASLGVFLAGAVLCLAGDVNMGVWKVNKAASTFGTGAPVADTVTYEIVGDSVKVIVDGVGPDGKAVHNEWVGKYDGKDYPVKGTAAYDSRAYTKIDDSTMNMVIKKGGKVIANGTIVVAPDGKSRRVKVASTDPNVTGLDQNAVYDKK